MKQNPRYNFIFLFLILLGFSCQRDIPCQSCTAENNTKENKSPIAIAGPDRNIVLPLDSIIADGSSSSDPDNNIVSYQWTKIAGPSFFNIRQSNTATTTITSLVEGVYQFELKVTDAEGLFSKDTMNVTVNSRNNGCNIDNRPVIQAHLVPLGNLSIGKVQMVSAAANNTILFAGGSSYTIDATGIPSHRIDIYEINSNTWSTKDLVDGVPYRMDIGIASNNKKIFIAGGGFWGDFILTSRVDIYNAIDQTWSHSQLSEGRTATVGVAAGNKIFFAGGYSYNNDPYWSNKVDIYNDETGTWTSATLSEGRGYMSVAAINNKVYFAGGEKNNGQYFPSDRIDEYDILSDTWSTSTLQVARSGMAAIAAGNKIFWAGGSTNSGPTGTVEIRDVVTGSTSFACIIPRAGLKAVSKDNKIIFFTGDGNDPRNGTHFEIYDIATDTWYTAILDKSVIDASIISVNNVIYVAGGFVNGVGSDKVWKLEF